MLVKQVIRTLIDGQYILVKYVLMAICALIEVPAFINAVDRITDWQLGVPVPVLGMTQGLLYGYYIPTNETSVTILKIFENTLLRGATIGLVYFVIIGAMVLIQSSIVSDDGFKKIIRKKIGIDLRPRLRDAVMRGNARRQQQQQLEEQLRQQQRQEQLRQQQREQLRQQQIQEQLRQQQQGQQPGGFTPEQIEHILELLANKQPEQLLREHQEEANRIRTEDRPTASQLPDMLQSNGSSHEALRAQVFAALDKIREETQIEEDRLKAEENTLEIDERRRLAEIEIIEMERHRFAVKMESNIDLPLDIELLALKMFTPVTDDDLVNKYIKLDDSEKQNAYQHEMELLLARGREFEESRLRILSERRRVQREAEEKYQREYARQEAAIEAERNATAMDDHLFESFARGLAPTEAPAHAFPQNQDLPQVQAEALRNNIPLVQAEDLEDAAAPGPDQDDIAQDDIQDFWAGPKNIGFILQVTVLANLVSCASIVTFKMIPSFIGLVAISLIDKSIIFLSKLLLMKLTYTTTYSLLYTRISSSIMNSSIWNSILSLPDSSLAIKLTMEYILAEIIKPCIHGYASLVSWKPLNTLYAKSIMLLFGYATLGSAIAITMRRIEKSCSEVNPLTANYRAFYILLLQLTSAVKVLTLMSIEWVVFPFYSGFLIQFALVAFSSDSVYTTSLPHHLILRNFLGVVPIWFLGTFFMYFFASFVGMIRKDIFRSGVLFFIRPSDDPNVRLIHDALMRPFGLKISRILLSAGVYTLYIIVEIITPMWSLRLFSPNPILPAQHKNWFETALYMSLFLIAQNMNNIFVDYWKFIFSIACHQMRLSSFLLDKQTTSERGRIVYRSLMARIRGIKPNYDLPIQEDSIDQYFKENPTVLSAFIPDGNFVRAPDNDSVSRKFVRTLFVPVSKTDRLLAPLPDLPDDEHIFNPYDDEEPLDSTTYTLVYRPPLFKTRIAGFFSILWIGSMLFTFGIYFANCLLKISIIFCFGNKLFSNEFYQIDPYSLIVTVSILSHYQSLTRLIKNDGENGEARDLWLKVRQYLMNFLGNESPKLWLAIMIPTLIGLGNQKLVVNSEPVSTIDIIVAQVLLIPFGYALAKRVSKPDNFKFYNLCAIIFIIMRFISLAYFTYGFGVETGSFVVDFSQVDFANNPPIFIFFMRYLVLNDPLGLEGKIFHAFWVSLSTFKLIMLISEYKDKFILEVRRKYYSSGRVLTNVELESDTESSE